MQKNLCTILFLFFVNVLYAQPAKIIFDHYGSNEGFNSREAMNIVTTKEGLIWISSNDGLVRYDSKTFKFYQHNSDDSTTIVHNYCKAMQVDKRGWIWIVSNTDLDIFNPVTEKFVHVKRLNAKNEVTNVHPLVFYYDEVNDMMWIGTQQGLFFSKNGSTALQSSIAITADKEITLGQVVTIVNEDKDILWLTGGYFIYKLNTRTGATEKYNVPEKVDNIINPKNTGIIYSSYFDKNKTLWLGTGLKGLIEFNTITKKFHQYTYRDYTKEDNTIVAIKQANLPDQKNILWLSATGFGFTAFNTETKQFKSYSAATSNDPLGIKGNTYGMHLINNTIWIGSAAGLHKYDFTKQLFNTIDLSSIAKGFQLPPVGAMAIEKDEKGKDKTLWLSIPYKNSYLYDFATHKILPIPSKIAKYLSPPTEAFTFFIDSKNILWISTNQYGLVGYDIKLDKIILPEKQYFFKTWEWVNNIFEDSNNQLWLGTFNGLFVMDKNSTNIQPVTIVNKTLKDKSLAKSIMGLTEDENKNIWFTADFSNKKNACIAKYEAKKNALTIVYDEQKQSNTFNQPVDLRDIVSNKNGQIFVTFFAESIKWFYAGTLGSIKFNILTQEQGLQNAYIDQLTEDTSGNIWCSLRTGISCYRWRQNIFTNYTSETYGLDISHAPFIYLSKATGIIYIGLSNAVAHFNTNFHSNNIDSANLIFTGLQLFNKPYNTGKTIQDGDVINLDYTQNSLLVNFALLSFTNSNDNTYSWKLEGLETVWNTSKGNAAAYTNLQPGHYTLLVKAANSSGGWRQNPIKLIFKISPPFYKTWWFILLCIVGIAGIIYYFVKLRIERIREKFKLRNKIASDLHDEIGSTLTSINILSNVSQQAMEKQPQQAKEMLQQIATQSKNIQQNMSDIVWSIRPDNEKIENLVVRMREFAAQTLEPLNIDTSITADESLIEKVLPMQYRKDILLIYKEAINNIAKHANATTAKILLTNGKKNITLTIADNGKWKGNNSGTGTKTMQERAKAIGGQLTIINTEAGTQILLTIPVP